MDEIVTMEAAEEAMRLIGDCRAPSQFSRFTRGKVIKQLAKAYGMLDSGKAVFHMNHLGTGNCAISTGRRTPKPIMFLAHLDEVSYAIQVKVGIGRYKLAPLCYHMIREGSRPAVALRFRGTDVEVAARGELVSEDNGRAIYFQTDNDSLQRGVRVCFESRVEIDSSDWTIHGSVDDAFAVAAQVLTSAVLARLGMDSITVLTDEEEGVTDAGNLSFCKGGARLFNRTPKSELPDLVVVSDIHESDNMRDGAGSSVRPGDGACFAEVSSWGRGEVVPPHLFEFERELGQALKQYNISLLENPDGYVSRSDGVSAMTFTPNVMTVGFLGRDRHFTKIPSANLKDLVHLAKSLCVYAAFAHDDEWRSAYLG